VCSNTQINFTHLRQQMFWPHDSNAIFEGKTDQLSTLIKSKIFTIIIGLSNFGIMHFKKYTFKLSANSFRFMGPLILVFLNITHILQENQ